MTTIMNRLEPIIQTANTIFEPQIPYLHHRGLGYVLYSFVVSGA